MQLAAIGFVFCGMKQLILLLCLASSIPGFAMGKVLPDSSTYFLGGSFFSHSVSLPFTASNGLLAADRLPGISLEAGLNKQTRFQRLQINYMASFSAYHQKELHYGYEMAPTAGITYQLLGPVRLYASTGISYLHTFDDAPKYQQKDGNYTQKRDWGRPQTTAQLTAGLQCKLSNQVRAVTKYTQVLQLPFAAKAGVAVVLHTRISLGLQYLL